MHELEQGTHDGNTLPLNIFPKGPYKTRVEVDLRNGEDAVVAIWRRNIGAVRSGFMYKLKGKGKPRLSGAPGGDCA